MFVQQVGKCFCMTLILRRGIAWLVWHKIEMMQDLLLERLVHCRSESFRLSQTISQNHDFDFPILFFVKPNKSIPKRDCSKEVFFSASKIVSLQWKSFFYNNHQAFRMNKLSQKQTSTSAFEAPEKFWKAKNSKSCRQNSKTKNVLCFFFTNIVFEPLPLPFESAN